MGREHARGGRVADQAAAAARVGRRAVLVGERRRGPEGGAEGGPVEGLRWVLRDFLIVKKREGSRTSGVSGRERKRERDGFFFFK